MRHPEEVAAEAEVEVEAVDRMRHPAEEAVEEAEEAAAEAVAAEAEEAAAEAVAAEAATRTEKRPGRANGRGHRTTCGLSLGVW